MTTSLFVTHMRATYIKQWHSGISNSYFKTFYALLLLPILLVNFHMIYIICWTYPLPQCLFSLVSFFLGLLLLSLHLCSSRLFYFYYHIMHIYILYLYEAFKWKIPLVEILTQNIRCNLVIYNFKHHHTCPCLITSIYNSNITYHS